MTGGADEVPLPFPSLTMATPLPRSGRRWGTTPGPTVAVGPRPYATKTAAHAKATTARPTMTTTSLRLRVLLDRPTTLKSSRRNFAVTTRIEH
jgi:hypothetical protein